MHNTTTNPTLIPFHVIASWSVDHEADGGERGGWPGDRLQELENLHGPPELVVGRLSRNRLQQAAGQDVPLAGGDGQAPAQLRRSKRRPFETRHESQISSDASAY